MQNCVLTDFLLSPQSYFQQATAQHTGMAGSMDTDINQPTEPASAQLQALAYNHHTDDYIFSTI